MYTKYNSQAICATYRLYTIHNTLMLYAVCSVFAMIIVRHTHIIKKGEIYQKPKSLVVWVGET